MNLNQYFYILTFVLVSKIVPLNVPYKYIINLHKLFNSGTKELKIVKD